MKEKRPRFSKDEFREATVALPKKLTSLQEMTKQAQGRLKQLANYASHTTYEIVSEGKTTGDRFLDMALVLASYLQQDADKDHSYHPDKIIDAVKQIHSRLTELDGKLKTNPGEPILLDRTKIYQSGGIDLSLDLGQLNRSPSISHAINKARLTSSWFWHEVARSMRINLEGYRELNHVDNAWHPPMIQIWTNPDYQNQWFSEDITGFFALSSLPDHDYNGLKQGLFGEATGYVGGIFIGKDEIVSHLNYARKILLADRNEATKAKNLAVLYSLYSIAHPPANP